VLNTLSAPVWTNPTMDLLLCCAAPTLTPQHISTIENLIDQADWQLLFQQAIDHRIMPLLYHHLNAVVPDRVPASIMAQLRQYVQSNKLRVLALNAELFRVLDAFAAAGVEAVAYKGGLLAQMAYGANDRRFFEDIDILVHSPDFFAPREVLQAQYRPYRFSLMSELKERRYCRWFGEYSMVNQENDIWLDVHHRLVAGDCSLSVNFDSVWQRLEPVTLMGRTVQTLKREDLLIYLCVSGMKDGWSYLRSVSDVAAMVGHNPDLDWQDIQAQAARLGVERMLYVGLSLAQRLAAVPVPRSLTAAIAADPPAAKIVAEVLQRLQSPVRPNRDKDAVREKVRHRWQSIDNLKGRLQYFYRSCDRVVWLSLHITSRDQHFLPLPTYLHFLYYVLRPVRVLNDVMAKLSAKLTKLTMS
jgi:hypothetical protein